MKRKYTAKTLEAAAQEYFESISRRRAVTEDLPTGELDKYGHAVFRAEPVRNLRGDIVYVTEFVEPPTVQGLCAALGISRQTWSEYRQDQRLKEAAESIRDVLQGWNERELLTREGKNIQGIVFNLKNNYGYADKVEAKVEGNAGGVIVLGDVLDDDNAE